MLIVYTVTKYCQTCFKIGTENLNIICQTDCMYVLLHSCQGFCVINTASVAAEYHWFKRTSLPPFSGHFTVKMKAARSSKTLVSCCNTAWHHSPEDFMSSLLLKPEIPHIMLV